MQTPRIKVRRGGVGGIRPLPHLGEAGVGLGPHPHPTRFPAGGGSGNRPGRRFEPTGSISPEPRRDPPTAHTWARQAMDLSETWNGKAR